ncbi:hypothetical protein [Streptomyces sp. NPDC003077]|uniref:hypothetical protein n=1 Tax=Streptomyces sp. NPDC003077 TaxID=3154443 RepID=UPI0033B333D7
MKQSPTSRKSGSAPRTTSGSGRWLVRLGVLGATGLAACLSATTAHASPIDSLGINQTSSKIAGGADDLLYAIAELLE